MSVGIRILKNYVNYDVMQLLVFLIVTNSLNMIFVKANIQDSECGVDNSPINIVYEGRARVETYPWLGILYYPLYKKRLTTAVVLITRQMVLASAVEIDKIPKNSFRTLSKVVLGSNCSGPTIGVRDYTNHPDYGRYSYSALAMIQLEIDEVTVVLRPICPPPSHFINPRIYAMALTNDCSNPIVNLYKMKYVSDEKCDQYYRRAELDISSMWPKHVTCAQAILSKECIWRSGTILVMKIDGRWRLIGFGIYGPGCGAPARFLDYGMYHRWVSRNIARIGRPAVSRMGSDFIILRRTLSNVQRYGPCDLEETKTEIFTDTTQIFKAEHTFNVKYNLSLYATVEYSCVVFRAQNVGQIKNGGSKPKLNLRRWCIGPNELCYDFQYVAIHFYIEIEFENNIVFKVSAYGQEPKVIDPLKAMAYANQRYSQPYIKPYAMIKAELESKKKWRNNYWFYLEDVKNNSLV